MNTKVFRWFTAFALAFLAMRGGVAEAETPAPYKMEQDKGVDCGEDTFVIQAAPQYAEWRVYTNGGAKSHSVADLLVAGQFLMGCEDEFPPLQVLLSNDPMGSLMFGDVATNGNQRAIALATIDTISPAEQFNLSVFYGFSWTWWNALDDVEDEQAYCAGQDA